MFHRHYAHLKLNFIPPQFNPLILQLAHLLLPLILRFRLRRWLIGGIIHIEGQHLQRIVELYHLFQNQKIRFILAFRHAEVEDPLVLLYLFSRLIPRAARAAKIPLKLPIHTHFIYDRGMTIWGGEWLGWLLSKGGGIPIHRGKPLDRTALKTARHLLMNGQFPMTIAPEGATNGHSEIVSPLEPGAAQLGFWTVEDLHKKQRPETVYILPIGIKYYFINPPWEKIAQLLNHLEQNIGLTPTHPKPTPEQLYPRLFAIGERLLSQMEHFYRTFYHQDIPLTPPDPNLTPNEHLKQRLNHLLDIALAVAEDHFNLPAKGTIIDRCRRLEEVSWNLIYREDIVRWQDISALERGLADWVAEEAELRVKNMRLVESLVAVTGTYVKEKMTAERFAETALILFDLVERLKGVKIPKRPRLGKRCVQITIGEAISVSEHYPTYKAGRQQAKKAVSDLTQTIQNKLEALSQNE